MASIGVASASDIPPVIAANSKRVRRIYAPLTCSLYSSEGPSPQFYRDTSTGYTRQSQVRDCYGVLRPLQHGEAAFLGARRVENLCRFSELLGYNGAGGWSVVNSATVAPINDASIPGPDGEQTGWKLTRGALANSLLRSESSTNVLRAVRHTFSVWLKTDSGGVSTAEIRVYVQGSIGTFIDTKVVSLTSTWQRFALSGTPNGSSAYVIGVAPISLASTSAGYCYVAFPQLEEIIGDTNFAPSEYVPRDYNPSRKYYLGSGVDGVQCFDVSKGNTWNSTTGLVTEKVGTALTTCKGILTYPSTVNHIQTSEDFSGFSKSDVSITVTANDSVAPDGLSTATKFDEGTAAAVHYLGVPATVTTANGQQRVFSVHAKRPSSGGRDWVRLFVTDRAGTNLSAYFNVATGAVGIVSANCWAYTEALANEWFRLIFSFSVGTGASEVLPRIYIADADNSPTYTGTNNYVWIWGAAFLTFESSGPTYSSRPTAVPYAKTTAGSQFHSGATVVWNDLEGVFSGLSEWSVYGEYSPLYLLSQTNKAAYSAAGPYILTDVRPQNSGSTGILTGLFNWDRVGITIRPPLSGGAANAKLAFDFYNGEPTAYYMWRANTYYGLGSVVVPTDTKPDNANARKMFIAVREGVSGGVEPGWVNTFVSPPDTTSSLTSDGTVLWQNNWNNGLQGSWEPYNMSNYLYTNIYEETLKVGWYISNDSGFFAAYVNGVAFDVETRPVPINPVTQGSMRAKPSRIYLGSLGTSRGIPNETIPTGLGTATAELMGVLTAAHKNICVWEGGVDPSFFVSTTKNGL